MNSSSIPRAAVTPPTAEAVVRFWFGAEGDAVQPAWFHRDGGFDAAIDQRFGAEVEAALRGRLGAWATSPTGRLALVLLLDQFTRNVFRGTPRAYAGDARALALAREAVARGEDQGLPLLRRWFLYLPYEHAEDAAAQDESVELFAALAEAARGGPHAEAIAGALDYAERHAAVIRRFGRFPHRNEVLGRPSTAEESAFLEEPGSRF